MREVSFRNNGLDARPVNETPPPQLSVVIPALNAAAELPATLAALAVPPFATEVVVVDGGSHDDTAPIAAAAGARVLTAPRGRGSQIGAGIEAARADWLLLLHADTQLAADWAAAVGAHLADPARVWRAGYFRFVLDDADPRARRVERRVAWRCRRLALPYGDQGLLIHRRLLDAVGGWRPLALMEDVDIVLRLGPRRLAPLDADAVTSAVRYRQDGYARRPLRNLAILVLYVLGLPTRLLRRLYA